MAHVSWQDALQTVTVPLESIVRTHYVWQAAMKILTARGHPAQLAQWRVTHVSTQNAVPIVIALK